MSTRATVLRQRRRLTELAWDLGAATSRDEIDRLVLSGIYDVIGGELAGKNVVSRKDGTTTVRLYPSASVSEEFSEALARNLHEHPAYIHFTTTKDLRPHFISDSYPSLLEFKRTRIYSELYGPTKLGTPHQLNIIAFPQEAVESTGVLRKEDSTAVCFALNRSEAQDFSACDRELATDIQFLLFKAYRGMALSVTALTARQIQVLRMVATGKTYKCIARELEIRPGTVARHISDAYQVLGVRNLATAVLALERRDLL